MKLVLKSNFESLPSFEPGQKLKHWLLNWFYWNQHPQIIQDSLVSSSTQNTLYAILCWLSEQNEQVHSESIFLLENWFPFILYVCFMLYILVLKICIKYVKHFIQLSQMSKMSNSRSRTQYNTLKLVHLDSVPLNWGKRYKFLLLSPNAFSWGHFVEYTE